jgi:DNA helicase-2/ATP-dependent DNA helicase PcrA
VSQPEESSAEPSWRLAERAWMAHLAGQGHLVVPLAEAVGNSVRTEAPMMQVGDKAVRSPDLLAVRDGVTEYWEVKFRSRPDVSLLTGESRYWMEYAVYADYLTVARSSGSRVWVVVHDAAARAGGGRWLRADIDRIRDVGTREQKTLSDGSSADAWVWNVTDMEVVPGPALDVSVGDTPLFPVAGPRGAVGASVLAPLERSLRTARPIAGTADSGGLVDRHVDVLRHDAQLALDVLRRTLGLADQPRYSVLRVGLEDLDVDDVLGLLEYGIRLFLVTSERSERHRADERLSAFEAARLLEWAVVPDLVGPGMWVVDGKALPEQAALLDRILDEADSHGGINAAQYRVVHAPHATDVIVAAGAGTGKTETMAERLVFLLATAATLDDPLDPHHVFDLKMEDVTLVTFTRDAAAEMRRRIARTLLLRQRLCTRCTLPATAWMLQSSSAEIETIHSFAKKVLERDGSAIGVTPGFDVGSRTMVFRRIVHEELAPHLVGLVRRHPSAAIPPVHELVRMIEELWNRLAGNGFSPLAAAEGRADASPDWGSPPEGVGGEIAAMCRDVVSAVGRRFSKVCAEAQVLPMSELVSKANDAVYRSGGLMRRRPRYLFVDEFQDTDVEQMTLFLRLRKAGARLFVVGDEKQAVYRFRGARGDSFAELEHRAAGEGLPGLVRFGLTRNFRSGARMLDLLHSVFAPWGEEGHLRYDETSRLRPGRPGEPDASTVVTQYAPYGRDLSEAVGIITRWRRESPGDSIALLCRQNGQAVEFRDALRSQGIPCELVVGGDFFTTPAVREARALLEAVLDPGDDAAVAELSDTRWIGGLTRARPPHMVGGEPGGVWSESLPALSGWPERLASAVSSRSFARDDLDHLRRRVEVLAEQLQRRPTLGWFVECITSLRPTSCPKADDDIDERIRYARCLDHLVTMMDDAFGDAPVSAYRLLEWLRLQIATNSDEDEPIPEDLASQGSVTALTVHKAKGLEFDRVLVPRTWTKFQRASGQDRENGRSHVHAAVVDTDVGPRLLWRWPAHRLAAEITNVDPRTTDSALWSIDHREITREETRLLYVAMTRARKHLTVLKSRPELAVRAPETWSDLVEDGLR